MPLTPNTTPQRQPEPAAPIIEILQQALAGLIPPTTALTSLFDRMERPQ